MGRSGSGSGVDEGVGVDAVEGVSEVEGVGVGLGVSVDDRCGGGGVVGYGCGCCRWICLGSLRSDDRTSRYDGGPGGTMLLNKTHELL